MSDNSFEIPQPSVVVEVKTEEKKTDVVVETTKPTVNPSLIETPNEPEKVNPLTQTEVKKEDMETLPALTYKAKKNIKVDGVHYKEGDPVTIKSRELMLELLEKKYVL